MRLNRLDLTRYGKFTDTSLCFGPPPDAGIPDFHIVYGGNEAGKSTLLSGWLDLLFQIPTQSDMAFLHPYKTMRLGAQLLIDGATHDVVRIKKRDHALLDAQDSPLPEALLINGLRGLDRRSYAAMFSLNRQTLDEGGESILASEGDLGELLFQASAGLTDLAEQLDTIRSEADSFLNTTGRKGCLRDLGTEFAALERQIKELDTAAADYARLSAARDDARDGWQSARARATQSQTDLSDLERRISAVPLADRLVRLDARIAEFGDLPHPPEGWFQDLPALDRAEAEMSTRAATAARTVEDLQQKLQTLPPQDHLLAIAPDIARAEVQKAAHDTALNDLPRRQQEYDVEAAAIQSSLIRLDRPKARALDILLPATTVARLRDLIQRHSGLITALETADAELTRTRAETAKADERLRAAGGNQQDLGGLEALVRRLRRDDPQGARDRAETDLGELEAQQASALAALKPWSGTAGDLARLPPCDDSGLDRIATELGQATRTADRNADTLSRLRAEHDQARLKLERLSTTGPMTLSDAANTRTARETAWRAHRQTLSPDSADAFERAMRLDDQITAALSDQRAQAAQAAEAQRDLAEKQQARDNAQTQADASAARRDALTARVKDQITAVSSQLPEDMGLTAFQSWLERVGRARDIATQCDRARRATARAGEQVRRALDDLRTSLTQAGQALPDDASLTVALETAQSLLDRAAELSALRQSASAARQDLLQREQAMQAAQSAVATWQANWADACANSWLADIPADVPAMRVTLDELDRLRSHCDRQADLGRRIQAMQDNRDRFTETLSGLAQRLDLPHDGPASDLWRILTDRLQQARKTRDQRADLTERLEQAQAQVQDIDTQSRLHGSRTGEMARLFGTGTWVETRDALTRAGARSELIQMRETLANDLCDLMRSPDPMQALALLQDTDPDALAARIEALKTDLETLRSAQEEAHTAYRQAENAVEAVGGDGAVARLQEQRQTLLLQIADGARRHLQQRLGILAVEQALHRYRDTHRSGMMQSASDAFRQMSGGRYSGLAAQPDGQREVLVAVAADGGSKEAAQLSEGTRAQLYLALRIAGYHEFARNTGQVPFVADDIMESFDDDRAAQAFSLLGQISQAGQVIYLTHHAHLCDIAQSACPEVRIHRLPG